MQETVKTLQIWIWMKLELSLLLLTVLFTWKSHLSIRWEQAPLTWNLERSTCGISKALSAPPWGYGFATLPVRWCWRVPPKEILWHLNERHKQDVYAVIALSRLTMSTASLERSATYQSRGGAVNTTRMMPERHTQKCAEISIFYIFHKSSI